MQQWEYKIVQSIQKTNEGTQDILNILGKKGWELVGFDNSHLHERSFYFKRLIAPSSGKSWLGIG